MSCRGWLLLAALPAPGPAWRVSVPMLAQFRDGLCAVPGTAIGVALAHGRSTRARVGSGMAFGRSSEVVAALAQAKARLDRLDLYPLPVRIERVRVFTVPAFFRLPCFRRYRGYALHRTILLRGAVGASEDLLTHELCHVWQMQHLPVRMPLTYMRTRYRDNPFEREARAAVADTRGERRDG